MGRVKAATALAAALAVGLVAVTPASSSSVERKPMPDVTVLFDKALKKVRKNPKFAKAVVLEADGSTRGDQVQTEASAITKWTFQFQNGGGSKFLSVSIKYTKRNGFAKPRGNPSPFLGDVVLRKAPRMTLDEAVSLLQDAGFGEGFMGVTLRNPVGPEKSQPLYIFTTPNGQFVAVNTKTDDVQEIR